MDVFNSMNYNHSYLTIPPVPFCLCIRTMLKVLCITNTLQKWDANANLLIILSLISLLKIVKFLEI